MKFNGVHLHLGNIMKLSDAVTRSITAENIHGEKGGGGRSLPDVPPAGAKALGQDEHQGSIAASRGLGQKWKVRPFISVPPLSTATLADVAGPGVIQHFWITSSAKQYRDLIVRMYWDDESAPSVEVPLADFFCNGWTINLKTFTPVNALPINANPHNGFNCYFPMPFRKHARVTLENRGAEKCDIVAYAINYALTEVEDGDAYFHAQFRRTNPLPFQEDYVILDGVKGRGQYVGTYLAWQQNSSGWWGEGEIKVFLDGDAEFPTICGTGTEDYFGGAWCFKQNFSAPYLGYPQGASTGLPGNRHGLYRFHILDPIRFAKDLRITMQAIGWRLDRRYLPLQDDIASVAYWYQAEPHAPFPALGSRDALEVV